MKDTYTISIKRAFSNAGLNIVDEVLKVAPDAKALSGDPTYAVDFTIPEAGIAQVRAALEDRFLIEDCQPLAFI